MDKIDVVLFRYKRERRLNREIKKILLGMSVSLIILFIVDVTLFFLCPLEYRGWITILYISSMITWSKIVEGKWGTEKWKYKLMNAYRERFKADQKKLIEIVRVEGLNCQQVYNLLIQRYQRMPQIMDKQTFAITIFSLIIAFAGILASPLQSLGFENYGEYLIFIIIILVFLGPLGYVYYRLIIAQNKQYDEKKNSYEYVIELLEDYLY